jgi:hypothetical protein
MPYGRLERLVDGDLGHDKRDHDKSQGHTCPALTTVVALICGCSAADNGRVIGPGE